MLSDLIYKSNSYLFQLNKICFKKLKIHICKEFNYWQNRATLNVSNKTLKLEITKLLQNAN
jgi:hypothetical protein